MLRRWLLPLVAVLLVLTACGGKDDPSPSTAGRTSTTASAAEGDGKIKLTVLDAGAAPRRALRLKVAAGAQRRVTMRMLMNIAQTLDGKPGVNVKTPPIDMGMVLRVDEVSGDEISGTFRYDKVNVVNDGSADPALIRNLQNSGIDKLTTVNGNLRVTTRGELLEAHINTPANFPAAMGQFLDQIEPQLQNMTVPFPREAVGVGARWSVATDLTLTGVRLHNEYVYKLVEASADAYRMELTLKQTAPAQDADLNGIKAHVVSFVTNGDGSVSGRLNELLPIAFASHALGDQTFQVNQGAATSTLVQHLDLRVTLH